MVNLDFSQKHFQNPNVPDYFCHYESGCSEFPQFLSGFSRFFLILVSINVIGYSFYFCCQQPYALPYISFQSMRLDTWHTLKILILLI